MLLSNQGPFPRPALPGVSSTTSPSATPPARPDPRGVPVWSMPDHRRGFPCCLFSHLPCVPAPVPRREQTGAPEARFPVHHRPSPKFRRVGSRDWSFGACTVFAYAPARMVAELLMQPFSPECFSPCRCLHKPPWLLPTGASVVARGSHPPERSALPWRTEFFSLSRSFFTGLFRSRNLVDRD